MLKILPLNPWEQLFWTCVIQQTYIEHAHCIKHWTCHRKHRGFCYVLFLSLESGEEIDAEKKNSMQPGKCKNSLIYKIATSVFHIIDSDLIVSHGINIVQHNQLFVFYVIETLKCTS